jgi:hypothetical protein
VPRLCEFYPGICLTTEEKAWKYLIQVSRRVAVGTMKTEYTEQNIRNNKNTKHNGIHKHNNDGNLMLAYCMGLLQYSQYHEPIQELVNEGLVICRPE